jgi:uncharacterized protein (TIGR00288 family)
MTQQPHAHLPRPHKEPPPHAPNAALLIDFDNVTMGIRSDLQTELKRLLQSDIIRGKVAVQRAYADWRRYPQYIVPLSESSIDLIFAPAYGSNKKNATDIRLAIDALELVFTRPEIGTFILLSGDSDFSSLVLKLKEYGKYVIGVGIRESSSDLLIQNCDEYYSYNELAGLTKETDVTRERRDPWELVVEAVKQMTAHNDVMRSDRLKQVMQEIDPSFNERDLGFSRFSKFVMEAARRGLINLTKLDNGQYEIALGPGVPGAAAQPAGARGEPAREASAGGGREPRAERSEEGEARGRGRGRGRQRGGFGLGEAFNLLKQALSRLGGGARPVDAEALRETMIELKGEEAEPLEPERFPKLLRQAHDAEIIDLSKEPDGAYEVRLRAGPEAGPAGAAAEVRAGAAEETGGEPEPVASAAPGAAGQPAAAAGGIPSRSARFRRGSRGPRVPPPAIPKVGVVEVDPNFKPRFELIPPRPAAEPVPSAPQPGPVREEEPEERAERGRGARGRGGRGSRGTRGGRGRRGGGGEERGSPAADVGPGAEGGERSRRRRGGRGRGGRTRTGLGAVSEVGAPPAPPSAQPAPTPRAAAAEAPEEQGEGGESSSESFWTKVKRGLIGGT